MTTISTGAVTWLGLGLGTEFRSEKIPRNRLKMISVISRKKVLIPRHSEFRGRANSEARNGTERNGIWRKNEVLRNSHCTASMITLTSNTLLKFLAAEFCVEQVCLPRNGSERNSDNLILYFFHGTEFRVVFSSAEGFGREF